MNDFQPRLRTRHIEENVKVMAKVIKKKILNLEREEIIKYLKKMGERNRYNNPKGEIESIVRQNNRKIHTSAFDRKSSKIGKLYS